MTVLKWFVFGVKLWTKPRLGLFRGWIQILQQAFPTLILEFPQLGMLSCKESNTSNKRKMNVFYTLWKQCQLIKCGHRQSLLEKTWKHKWAEKNSLLSRHSLFFSFHQFPYQFVEKRWKESLKQATFTVKWFCQNRQYQ